MTSKIIAVFGASKGIGLETVKILASDSENSILAFARSASIHDSFKDSDNVQTFQIDLSDPNLRKTIEEICAPFEKIDVMINNAGYLVNKPFEELSDDDFSRSYEVNVISVMKCVQALLPKLTKVNSHIVNISSMGGFQGSVKFPGLTAYSTSKAALVSFTELFSEEYKSTSIKMNCLCLGAVQTEMLEAAFPGYLAPLQAKEMATYIADFARNGHKYYAGKILPVSLSTP